jgi:hypothetical protein
VRWEYDASRVGTAYKAGNASGNLGGVGEPLPPGCLATLSTRTREREFVLWAYSPAGEVTRTYRFDAIPIEDAGPNLQTGRIDPTGSPTLTYHDGYLKAFYAQYGAAQVPEQLFRLNLGYRLVP